MTNLFAKLHADENGFIVSAELVLIATICVLGLIAGLSELAWNVSEELEDVGAAFNCVDQSYHSDGIAGHKGWAGGFGFRDHVDYCGGQDDLTCDN
ncbi:MAG: branched-chain amino acid aminotransferase [Planctomycetaceae bacterium]